MYRVALIQNQSEMLHYSYADARQLLRELGYAPTLFTAQNIDELTTASMSRFEAVIIASNSLNDKTIRAHLCEGGPGAALSRYVESGRGVLLLHQLGFAIRPAEDVPFLAPRLRSIRPAVRPNHERASSGDVSISASAGTHRALTYPSLVDPATLRSQAKGFRGLPGIYWHYWDGIDLLEWDPLLIDETVSPSRALLLCTKQAAIPRVILSSLALDWQGHRQLLDNVLSYLIEGPQATAIVDRPDRRSASFQYFIHTLSARGLPFREYSFDNNNLELLRRGVESGVHPTLVVGPSVDRKEFASDIANTLSLAVDAGTLRILAVTAIPNLPGSVSLSGRLRFARTMLQDLELRVQGELRNGYIDGSFWSTAETLQTLESLPECHVDFRDLVERTLRNVDEHDRAGSYDETFGITCAAFWVRAQYLGLDHVKTQSTGSWIRQCLAEYDDRERALAYATFAEMGNLDTAEKEQLHHLLRNLRYDRLTTVDCVTYLRAALAIANFDTACSLIVKLNDLRAADPTLDYATAAQGASTVLDALAAMRNAAPPSPAVRRHADEFVFATVISIQEVIRQGSSRPDEGAYPWDGKASTAAKCLAAWLKFDDTLDMPVYEITEALDSHGKYTIDLASGRTALAVLEQLRQHNVRLELAVLSDERRKISTRHVYQRRALAASTGLLAYILFALVLAAAGQSSQESGLGGLLHRAFVSPWAVHFGLIFGVVGTALGALGLRAANRASSAQS